MVIIKRILKVLVVFVVLILLLWSAVVGLIATPEILTPRIVDILQQHTKSEVSIKSVDLSLFTRFPNITLRIDSLRIPQTKDSISDLVFARQCRIAVDPVALLSKKIQINHVSLQDASIYIYADSLHGPMKTFILPDSQEEEGADSVSSMDLSGYSLSVRRLKIDSTQIVIDDRTKEFYTRVENFGVDMSMNLTDRVSDLDVITGFSNLIVWQKGDLLVKKTSMELRSQMELNRDSMQLSFQRARIHLNGIDLKARGTLRRDTINNGVLVDMKSSLNTPSISEFLALIPSSIIDEKDQITTEGSVLFDIDVKGLYSDESIPTFGATLKIEDATAKYSSRKLALESVNCDAYMYVDLNTPKNSYADIKSFQVNTSNIIDLNFRGKVTNIIEDPYADLVIKSNVNLNRFSEVFPLNGGIICKGSSQGDIKTQFSVSDMQSSNFAKLYIDGETHFQNLELSFDASKFAQDTSSVAYLYMQAESGTMLFGDNIIKDTDSRTLRSKINFQGLGYKAKSGEFVAIKDIELTVGANFDRVTSLMNGVGVRGIAKNTEVGIDSLFSTTLESSDITVIVTPQNEERKTKLKSTVVSRQITVSEPTYNSEVELSAVDMDVTLQKVDEEDREWSMDGNVAFADLNMFTDLFPIEIEVPQTSVTVSNKKIHLDNAHVRLGHSDIVATGYIQNLFHKLFIEPRAAMSGELAIKASYIDFGELMEASNKSVLMTEEIEGEPEYEGDITTESVVITEVADSLQTGRVDSMAMAPSTVFMVPRRVEFLFDLNIDKAKFEDAIIENVIGRATIKDSKLSLDRLTLRAIGARAKGSMVYRNIDRRSSNIIGDLSLMGVDINRIGELLPSITSMLPMIEEFEGIVDLDIKANANLDINSEPDISTLTSSMRLKGRDLVLMDSETFTDLSKTLMFKNKDRNLIDSVEVYALIDKSTIDVLPFQMSIDRYTAIIGGSQVIDPITFDVDYDYNISIMKSPLPFKAGIDISGNLEDYKFKVTSAKLKKTNFDEQRAYYEEYRNSIEESSIELQKEIEAKRKLAREKREAERLAQEQAIAKEEAAQSEGEDTVEGEDDGTSSGKDVETADTAEEFDGASDGGSENQENEDPIDNDVKDDSSEK